MKDPGVSDDSWVFRSIMSVPRPSWMNDTDADQVRISVGTYMRGRSESLGSLGGERKCPRVSIP